ncbi:hypothetical protein BH09MYX1_BH09MYX1_31190 [soil metagenome]
MTERRRAPPAKRVREGHGANCSSLGSVVDTLFASAAISGAVLAAVAAALATEEVRVQADEAASPPAKEDAP